LCYDVPGGTWVRGPLTGFASNRWGGPSALPVVSRCRFLGRCPRLVWGAPLALRGANFPTARGLALAFATLPPPLGIPSPRDPLSIHRIPFPARRFGDSVVADRGAGAGAGVCPFSWDVAGCRGFQGGVADSQPAPESAGRGGAFGFVHSGLRAASGGGEDRAGGPGGRGGGGFARAAGRCAFGSWGSGDPLDGRSGGSGVYRARSGSDDRHRADSVPRHGAVGSLRLVLGDLEQPPEILPLLCRPGGVERGDDRDSFDFRRPTERGRA